MSDDEHEEQTKEEVEQSTTPSDFLDHEPSKYEKLEVCLLEFEFCQFPHRRNHSHARGWHFIAFSLGFQIPSRSEFSLRCSTRILHRRLLTIIIKRVLSELSLPFGDSCIRFPAV
jgi:hypothetical protein